MKLKKLPIVLAFFMMASAAKSQVFVDNSGSGCAGNAPCLITVQAGVDAATAGQTVTVYPGTYNENVIIAMSVTLQSLSGSATTTIAGISPRNLEAAIMIKSPVNGVTIGGSEGHGFTIVGIDNVDKTTEAAAILVGNTANQDPISNINISYNTITAKGESGILTYNQSINVLSITHNLFDGKTFTGATPASGTLFGDKNTAKSAIAINSASNTEILNNVFSTTVGASFTGNLMVQITSAGTLIKENDFAGFMGGFGSASGGPLRVRGSGATISCNRFSMANAGFATGYVWTDVTPAPYNTATIAQQNTYLPNGSISGNNIVKGGSTANSAYPAPGCYLLPLVFLSVQASYTGNNNIAVQWKTGAEVNNSKFIVEQSANGVTYTPAATVASQGNGSFTYTTTLRTVSGGANYIRIQQVDKDGKYTTSTVVVVPLSSLLKLRAFPNPATTQLTVSGLSGKTTLQLYNYTGALVSSSVTQNSSVTLAVKQFPAGTYLLKASADGKQISAVKVLIQH